MSVTVCLGRDAGSESAAEEHQSTHPDLLVDLLLLLPPHLDQRCQALVVWLVSLERVEGLHQHLADVAVAAVAQQLLGGIEELLVVEVAREGRARVVGQDARQHDGVVLPRRLGRVVAVQELADDARALGGRGGGRLGRLDDRREEGDLVALGWGSMRQYATRVKDGGSVPSLLSPPVPHSEHRALADVPFRDRRIHRRLSMRNQSARLPFLAGCTKQIRCAGARAYHVAGRDSFGGLSLGICRIVGRAWSLGEAIKALVSLACPQRAAGRGGDKTRSAESKETGTEGEDNN